MDYIYRFLARKKSSQLCILSASKAPSRRKCDNFKENQNSTTGQSHYDHRNAKNVLYPKSSVFKMEKLKR